VAGRLRILQAGPGATIQDKGRLGALRYGMTPAGPMDWVAFRTANLALGNDEGAASVEIPPGGLEMVCEEAPLRAAFAGGSFLWRRNGALLPAAARITLHPGDILSARAGAFGAFTYLAIENGIDVPLIMGSRATHLRSQIGGMEGRMLRAGDVLTAASGSGQTETETGEGAIEASWLARDARPFRVVPGPQDDYFTAQALATFFSQAYVLTQMADRMAYRLEGPEIAHAGDYNIVSDGIALGAIQVAGDRKPMILMADRQPTGGYPKLGHVARVDIGRLAQLRPGEFCRFEPVGIAEARAALLRLENEIAETSAQIAPLRKEVTAKDLLVANLVDGFVDALEA
jgi:biotin-dependent carboxylase-like uncharacterized protein